MADYGFPTHEIGEGFLAYIRLILKKDTLSNKETLELFEQYRQGDEQAFKKIAEGNLWLVVKCAISNFGAGVTLEDLIQEGNLGLLKAIQSFDSKVHSNFTSYANKSIYQSIRDAYHYLPYLIKLPSNQIYLYKKIQEFKRDFEQKYGYEPSPKQIDIGEDVNKDMLEYLALLPDNLSDIIVDVDPDTIDSSLPHSDTATLFTKQLSAPKDNPINKKKTIKSYGQNCVRLDDYKSTVIHEGDRIMYYSRLCTVKKIHSNGMLGVIFDDGSYGNIVFRIEKEHIKKKV